MAEQEAVEVTLARLDERGKQLRADITEVVTVVRPLPDKLGALQRALTDHMAEEIRLRADDHAIAKEATATRVTRLQMWLTFAGIVVGALVGLIGILLRH